MLIDKPLICILSIIIGYIIGSFLPAYFFGLFKKKDLRKEGTGNPGTMNLHKILGFPYSIPCAIYDTLKGLLAMYISWSIGGNFLCIQLSGFAAITGHIFPFYLKFRGGQGIACTVGIMLFYLINYIRTGIVLLYVLPLLLFIVLLFAYITKSGEIIGIIVLPVLCYSLFMYYPLNPYNIFLCIIISYIISIAIYNIIKQKLLVIKSKKLRGYWWRVILRPFALIFVIYYLSHTQNQSLILMGSVTLFFIILDIVRFFNRQTEEFLTVRIKSFFKKHEKRRFSSMTMFLLSGFITILVFEKPIAISAFSFLVFGDIFSKIFGLGFGKHKLFRKTLEGTLAYFGCSIIVSFILFTTLNISFLMLCIGALAAALSEVLPLGLDDNFTVSLISGAVMTVMKIL